MSVAIGAPTYRLSLNPAQGTFSGTAIMTVTGLTAGGDNVFSSTSDGTSTGTPLIPANASIIEIIYIPVNGTSGTWYEKAVPALDANGNAQFSLTSAASGPTSFRIIAKYGVV